MRRDEASIEGLAAFVCSACGTQFAPSRDPPARCPICADERQYVPADGQRWTTLAELRRAHANEFLGEEAGLTSIRTVPGFAIAQRAFLVEDPGALLPRAFRRSDLP